jgi:hypothetical protein
MGAHVEFPPALEGFLRDKDALYSTELLRGTLLEPLTRAKGLAGVGDVPCVILHANDMYHLRNIAFLLLERELGVRGLREAGVRLVADDGTAYEQSEHHILIRQLPRCLAALLDVLRQRRIHGNRMTLVIDAEEMGPVAQAQMDAVLNAWSRNRVVILAPAIGRVVPSLRSRSTCLSCAFRKANQRRAYDKILSGAHRGDGAHFEELYERHHARFLDILVGHEQAHLAAPRNLLTDVREKKLPPPSAVQEFRAYAQRVCLANLPVAPICLEMAMAFRSHPAVADAIELCAACEHARTLCPRGARFHLEALFSKLLKLLAATTT